ncbi:flagellar type III secretion system pore protein FliP [Gemmatimonas phototrophica]|uniref:flagellar type III secretion system pore protein FliP n=1 Tax=Gemmatimonas phototrophica TaxID=1379270 RepID=UPI0009EF56E8|nr:flagellar type III secretion system pore protein FliP [Gemmatimonas phototrophica]
MLTAVLGVVAALAFVLGLGAVCLWALKRWGTGALGPKSRVAVEVVQRVPLGPKTGLTVVRVGEKVVALSVCDGTVTPLFELEESDRQRIIASSTVPQPLASSAEATAAFASLSPTLPGEGMATRFGTMLGKAIAKDVIGAPVAVTTTAAPAVEAPASAPVVTVAPFSLAERSEIPRFLTAPLTTRHGAPVTYSAAARLVALAGLLLFSGASQLTAQAAPPTPPVTQPAVTATPAATPATASTPATAAQAPTVIDLPPLDLPPLAPITKGQPARIINNGAPVAPRAPRPGNGADLTAQAAAARRPTNAMVVDSAQDPKRTAQAASPAPIAADDAIMRMMPQMDVKLGGNGEDGGLRLNGTVGIVVMMGLLTLLPTLILMMTGFTRILIVLQFLKQAMGTQSAPPGQLLAAMALLLTGFVMGPTLSEMNRTAITPWLDGKMSQVEMMKEGVKPMREFMLRQTRESDVKTFVELSRMPRPATVDDVPLHVLMSAFVASELRTAFQIGFAIYLPFIIIDAVVASVLMSMGMFMLPPAMISLPFKLLLFVLVDGWSLTITSLVQSFK